MYKELVWKPFGNRVKLQLTAFISFQRDNLLRYHLPRSQQRDNSGPETAEAVHRPHRDVQASAAGRAGPGGRHVRRHAGRQRGVALVQDVQRQQFGFRLRRVEQPESAGAARVQKDGRNDREQ